MRRIVIACLLLVACDAPAAPPHTPPTTTRAPTAPVDAAPLVTQSSLHLALESKPIAISAALALAEGDHLHVGFYAKPVTCEGVDYLPPHAGLELELAPRIEPAGTLAWATVYLFYPTADGSMVSVQAYDNPWTVHGDAKGSGGGSLAIDIDHQDITVHGTATVTGCGAKPPSDKASPKPAATATMTVAGYRIPLAAAVYRNDGVDWVLVLSSDDAHCNADGVETGSKATVLRLWRTPAGKFERVELRGLGAETTLETSVPRGFELPPDHPPRGSHHVAIKLGGGSKIGGYAVELAGTLDAVVCR